MERRKIGRVRTVLLKVSLFRCDQLPKLRLKDSEAAGGGGMALLHACSRRRRLGM
jgi:hypothetical protein